MSSTATEAKPPITCHVLDTGAGRPAANIPVTLTLLPYRAQTPGQQQQQHQQQPVQFTSATNADGRVVSWTPSASTSTSTSTSTSPNPAPSLRALYTALPPGTDTHWTLTFTTEPYFAAKGQDTFFPEVQVRFVVRAAQRERGEHFHVPVLVGGCGYTAYRGS